MDRFFSKVKKTDSCWNWTAALRSGYGAFKLNGEVIGAHRFSWEYHFGKIKNGLCVCHKCDNPKCVNPKHLFLGTYSDNSKDAYRKGRVTIPDNSIMFEEGNIPVNRTLKSKEEIVRVKNAISTRKGTLKQLAIKLNLPDQLLRDISSGRVYNK